MGETAASSRRRASSKEMVEVKGRAETQATEVPLAQAAEAVARRHKGAASG